MTKINKLLWLDMEFTNIDTTIGQVLEIAAIATKGRNFEQIGEIEIPIKVDEAEIDQMKHTPLTDWSSGKPESTGRTIYDMHTESGLIAKLKDHGLPKEEAEAKFVKFIEKHFDDEAVYLAGNSIRVDRAFLEADWPNVEKLLHYRMVDVTAFKLMMRMRGVAPYEKKKTHLAMDDVHESIEEMKYYGGFINEKPE